MPDFDNSSSDNSRRKSRLRKQRLAARRDLANTERDNAADGVAARVIHAACFQQARHIAGFLALATEIPVDRIMLAAEAAGKQVWVPLIEGGHMAFARWSVDAPMVRGPLGIRQPEPHAMRRSASELDLVLTPLVGFTDTGVRLGMGGGYYDRTFAFRGQASRPILLGVAHESARVDYIPEDPWDVTLDGVVTNSQWHINPRRQHGLLAREE